ncbi:TonB-dependent receptor [Loktanella sp. S4079]|nr:TonB-dependent receptor [Loktanella sp. S4079]
MKKTAVLAVLLATASSAVLAQSTDPVDLGAIRIEGASAQTVLGNDAITEEEIAERNAATIADVFAGESAVTASGGAPIAQKVFVNGIEESLLSVTIDGARQNKSAFHHTGNILLDPALLQSVEVSAGLAPADQGPNALAGAINYTTKDARDLLEPGDNFGGFNSLTAGNNGLGLRNTVALYGETQGVEYLLSGTRASGEDYADGDGNTIVGTRPELTDIIGKLAFTTQEGKRISFAASQTSDEGKRAMQGGFIRPDFAEVVGRETELYQALSERTSYTLTYTDENPQGQFAPFAQLSYNEQAMDVGLLYGVNTSLSGVVKNEFQLGNGTLTAGVDFFRETAEGFDNSGASRVSSGKEELSNIGLFAQARQDLTARVSTSFGVRYDFAEFDAADGRSFKDDGGSVNGSIDYALTDALTFNAGLASSWGGYELGEAALINFRSTWTYDGFTSSRAEAARIGLRYEQNGLAVRGALFNTDISDLNAVLPDSGARGATASMNAQGFDGAVEYSAGWGFVALNYTYADVTVNDDTVGTTAYYLGRPVGHMIGLSGAYALNDALEIGGTAQIALENTDTPTPLPGYEVVDVYAQYVPTNYENLSLRVDVRNLFDATYASRSSDGIDSERVVPLTEPGRTLSLTAKITF